MGGFNNCVAVHHFGQIQGQKIPIDKVMKTMTQMRTFWVGASKIKLCQLPRCQKPAYNFSTFANHGIMIQVADSTLDQAV